MEFDDLIKKRLMELEEYFRKIIENSNEMSDIREYLADNGFHAVLCLMTVVYRSHSDMTILEDDYFEEEIDEQLESDFCESVCEHDKRFLKKIQDMLDY
ncbi:MAG: hypothetical protein AB1454_11700 [Candidatus Auribacterota bacterium]